MSAATVNAERRLRERVAACAYDPPPPEIRDIKTMLQMLDDERARADLWATATKKLADRMVRL